MTEWPEYRVPNWNKIDLLLAQKVVFDFRNQYSSQDLEERGYTYECIGRSQNRRVAPTQDIQAQKPLAQNPSRDVLL